MNFKDYLVENDESDPVKRWQMMRQSVFNNTTERPTANLPQQLPTPKTNIPQPILDAVSAGFETGGVVSPQIIKFFKLDSENYSLVADSTQYTSGSAYPFVKEKKMGRHTGKILFVKGYPVSRFISKLEDLVKDRTK